LYIQQDEIDIINTYINKGILKRKESEKNEKKRLLKIEHG